jgi:single-strand selective monofunctional uracil DNA glycosylase
MAPPRAPSDAASVTRLIRAARRLNAVLGEQRFSSPVSHVYNPLQYAWACHEAYLRKFAIAPKRVVFLGMNPGPFGMVQTGVPFGEVKAVRDWLGLTGPIGRPEIEHPRRPITGFACERSEVSGRRLWGLFAQRFIEPEEFFRQHLVLNYCPLAFMESTGRNLTPDKVPGPERTILFEACDQHLREVVEVLRPQWLIGIGDFARRRAEIVFPGGNTRIGLVLHPSPANPQANQGWAALVTRQLEKMGVWPVSADQGRVRNQIRRPKSEGRKKAEIRNPNS